ncbi:MAG: TetR/AcrR family transcriptional regulator [Hornefia sp.]|nr:TetR/AcrR family transcriptional regulator [Hornefia sp.]
MCSAKRLSEKERKKEIMNSAVKVILKKGFDNTTMEDIIAGTTLSKGGVYHYYGNVVEIFRDIMLFGIEYRNEIIRDHLRECREGCENQFMAKQLVDKILDDNPYIPLYVEFLIAKKRNPKLNNLMPELQEQTKNRFEDIMGNSPGWLSDQNIFQFLTDFINAMILASNILDARECFAENRENMEQMLIFIFDKVKENRNESL